MFFHKPTTPFYQPTTSIGINPFLKAKSRVSQRSVSHDCPYCRCSSFKNQESSMAYSQKQVIKTSPRTVEYSIKLPREYLQKKCRHKDPDQHVYYRSFDSPRKHREGLSPNSSKKIVIKYLSPDNLGITHFQNCPSTVKQVVLTNAHSKQYCQRQRQLQQQTVFSSEQFPRNVKNVYTNQNTPPKAKYLCRQNRELKKSKDRQRLSPKEIQSSFGPKAVIQNPQVDSPTANGLIKDEPSSQFLTATVGSAKNAQKGHLLETPPATQIKNPYRQLQKGAQNQSLTISPIDHSGGEQFIQRNRLSPEALLIEEVSSERVVKDFHQETPKINQSCFQSPQKRRDQNKDGIQSQQLPAERYALEDEKTVCKEIVHQSQRFSHEKYNSHRSQSPSRPSHGKVQTSSNQRLETVTPENVVKNGLPESVRTIPISNIRYPQEVQQAKADNKDQSLVVCQSSPLLPDSQIRNFESKPFNSQKPLQAGKSSEQENLEACQRERSERLDESSSKEQLRSSNQRVDKVSLSEPEIATLMTEELQLNYDYYQYSRRDQSSDLNQSVDASLISQSTEKDQAFDVNF